MFGRILIVCLTYRVIVTFMAKFLNRSTRLLACLLTDYKLKKKRRTMQAYKEMGEMSTHTCSSLESDAVVPFTLQPLLFPRKTFWHLLSKYLDGLQNGLNAVEDRQCSSLPGMSLHCLSYSELLQLPYCMQVGKYFCNRELISAVWNLKAFSISIQTIVFVMDHFFREGAESSYHILRHRLYHGNEFVSPLLCKFFTSPLKQNTTRTAVGSHDCGN